MGCGASTAAPTAPARIPPEPIIVTKQNNRIESSFYIQTINSKSPLIRLDHCDQPKLIQVQGNSFDLRLKYVYASQRGYYPDDLTKANQDSYVICESLLGDNSCNLFGIFDGHGQYGDKCSHFSANELPQNLVKHMNKSGGLSSIDGDKMESVYTKAFIDTDKNLHSSAVDDLLSGTTGVTILQKGDKLFVANVGDSRAIIASVVDGRLVSSPLSSDQTPYRKDERERLKKAGAKIMTIDQIEGNEPIHENFGTQLDSELDEVCFFLLSIFL